MAAAAVRVKEVPWTFVVRLVKDASRPLGHRRKGMSVGAGDVVAVASIERQPPGNAMKQT
jgi:hypothetical protein